jgi:hypothetical protein
MQELLLTRDQFREAIFARDRHMCVNCGQPGQDAHHIIERRLFPDGGYYIDNGATLCAECHIQAEATTLDCDTIRARAGIRSVVLPPDFEADARYDKWGNPILEKSHLRLHGPLFEDDNVQKALSPVLHFFVNRFKYPRTFHLPWSPGIKSDDKALAGIPEEWYGMEVVITQKMDGENTTMYRDGLHARSLEFASRPDRDRIRAIHAEIAYEIPEGMRICGENMTAVHSIKYTTLADWFLVFSIWEGTSCLSWTETLEWCALLGTMRLPSRPLPTVPILYWGPYSDELLHQQIAKLNLERDEGLVVRPAGRFKLKDFPRLVGKYVRAEHVQTDEHWTRRIEFNGVAQP